MTVTGAVNHRADWHFIWWRSGRLNCALPRSEAELTIESLEPHFPSPLYQFFGSLSPLLV